MEHVCRTTVSASEVLRVVIFAHFGHERLYLCKLLVKPVVEFSSAVFHRKLGDVELGLERRLAEQVEHVPVMQGAEEADFRTVAAVLLVVGHGCKVVVEQRDVVSQTGICPLHTD